QGRAGAAALLAARDLRQRAGAGGGAVRDHDQGGRVLDHPPVRARLRCRRRRGRLAGRALAVAGRAGHARAGHDRRAGRAQPGPDGELRGDRLDGAAAVHGGGVHRAGHQRRALLPDPLHARRGCAVPDRRPGRRAPRPAARPAGAGPAHRTGRADREPVLHCRDRHHRHAAAVGLRRQAAHSRRRAQLGTRDLVVGADPVDLADRNRRLFARRQHVVLESPWAASSAGACPSPGGAALRGRGRIARLPGAADRVRRAGPCLARTHCRAALRAGGLHRSGARHRRRGALMAGRQPSNDTRSRFERWLPHPWLTLVLVLLWILLLNSFSVGGLLMGVVLGVLISHLTSQFWPERPPIKSFRKAFSYLGLVAWDVVVANLQVARIILFRRADALDVRWVVLPLELRSPEAISVLAGTITMTPGTVSCD